MKYVLVDQKDLATEEVVGQILHRYNDDGSISYIPVDESNADYREYLNPSEAKIK